MIVWAGARPWEHPGYGKVGFSLAFFSFLIYFSRNDTLPPERVQDVVILQEDSDSIATVEGDTNHRHRNVSTRQVDSFPTDSETGSLSLIQQDCCLFLFLDGSAFYFDDFMKEKAGEYLL